MGIILSYLYDSVFFNHAIASRAIPLVLALLSGNCPLIIESLENSEKILKYLIFINLSKISFK